MLLSEHLLKIQTLQYRMYGEKKAPFEYIFRRFLDNNIEEVCYIYSNFQGYGHEPMLKQT